HHAFSSGAGRTSDGNGSHASTLKSPSYTKSVSWQHYQLVASGDVYNSGYGLFPSEQARKDWQNARKKLSRAKLKKPSAVDPDLIWSLPDGEIRRYDRRQNIICRECRKSEVMQRILAFYQGNARYLLK
ncbi:DUF977 family protein, partial [Escherichia sp. WS1114]|uniref:DUF977 family protein n=1 Tax=Escherichia sp. WS1114 TaxID=3381924 RepID=UPI00396F5AF3